MHHQGRAVNQKEEEESKCRQFVHHLNRLADHERYRYIGHVSELEGKEFPDFLILDRRTSRELQIECTRFAPEWLTVEKANMEILERRFAYGRSGAEKYSQSVSWRVYHSVPLHPCG